LQKLSQLIQVDESVLRGVLDKNRKHSISAPGSAKAVRGGGARDGAAPLARSSGILERSSVRLLALAIAERGKREFDPAILATAELRELYKRREELYDGRIDLFDSSVAREVLVIAEELAGLPPDHRGREFKSLTDRLARARGVQQLADIRGHIRQAEAAGDLATMERHLAQWQTLNQEFHHTIHAGKNEDN
ncbi:MAG: hypothetical protein HYS45_03375, partial [Parcubacteria group bacterium]|nr:hypothetical protein [Parcubacteria group bacterium]